MCLRSRPLNGYAPGMKKDLGLANGGVVAFVERMLTQFLPILDLGLVSILDTINQLGRTT